MLLVPEASYPRNSSETTLASSCVLKKEEAIVDSNPLPLSGEGELSSWLRALPSSVWQIQVRRQPVDTQELSFLGRVLLLVWWERAREGEVTTEPVLLARKTSSPISDLILIEGTFSS